jgi:uncharacterized protein (TIGR02266 family)
METRTWNANIQLVRETLEAASITLSFALEHAQSLREIEPSADAVFASLVKGLWAVSDASSSDLRSRSVQGHVANALVHIRAAAVHTKQLSPDHLNASPTARAVERAIALLLPLAQVERSSVGVGSTQLRARRRRRPVMSNLPPLFKVDFDEDSGAKFFTGFDGHISSGGLFVATYNIHPIGTTVIVKVRLPSGHLVAERANVKWIREFDDSADGILPGMGVVFERLAPKDQRRINRYVAEHETIFYEAV